MSRLDQAKSRLKTIASHLTPPTSSPNQPVFRHELSPTYFLPRAASIEPNAEAIVHTTANGKPIRRTYKEFADRAAGLGWWLKKHGFRRVGLLAPNTPAYLEAVFGIGGAGAVQVGINYRLKADDIHYIFGHSEVDCIIVDREFTHLLEGFDEKVRRVVDDDEGAGKGEFEQCILEGWEYDKSVNGGKGLGWEALHKEPENEEDLLALAYTSGTTARPKGVEYTHRGVYLAAMANVIESGLNVQSVLTNERAKYLSILPFFHATGWTVYWSVVSVRGTHFTLRKIDYPHIWRLLKTEGITHFAAAPTVNTLLCADSNATKLGKPVRVTVAASPPSAKLFEDMIGLGLLPVHVYGLTETYGPITKGYFLPEWHDLPKGQMYVKMARQGHGFITSRAVRVLRVAPEGEPPLEELIDVTKDGKEIGEIVFSGNITTPRYHKDPSATEKLHYGGVLRSGDLAVWHPDGSIQILDRAKDIIISGGENISSVSLEGMLAKHPSILEVAVVGVQDLKYGERPRAYITLKEGWSLPPEEDDGGEYSGLMPGKGFGEAVIGRPDHKHKQQKQKITAGSRKQIITGQEIVSWAKSGGGGISGFMVPREVIIVPELPKTSTGKVRKNVLREWAKAENHPTPM